MNRLQFVGGFALLVLVALVFSTPEQGSAAAGQIASISCSQWVHAVGDADTIGYEDTHNDFTNTGGQGGGALEFWTDPNSQYWGIVDSQNDGNEVAVVWMLCIPSGANHPDEDFVTIYDLIRDRWPTQPIYVIPLDVEQPPCSRGGYDESVTRQQWVLDNLPGTLPGPELTPPLQANEVGADGCHPTQAGVDRYVPLLEQWVPVMLSGGTINSGTFWDDDGLVHEGYIEAIAALEITLGCDVGRYCPFDPVTRAQMASFIDRAFDLPNTLTNYFTDDDGNTHEGAINRIAAAGITLGCNAGNADLFCPNDIVSRAQMASFIDRAIELNATSIDFFDDDDGITHEAAINRIANDGITLGCFAGDPTLFCPWDPVTRAQMASFLGRALDLEEIWP